MSYFERRFVVDTNALIQLGWKRRVSEFFLENAVIPEEVIHETSGFPDVAALRENVHPTTPRMLQLLTAIMASVPKNDTRLVDLYANKGNADPLVVACALERQEHDSQFLLRPEWVVVTADEAVQDKAQGFGLKVLTTTEFKALIDENGANA